MKIFNPIITVIFIISFWSCGQQKEEVEEVNKEKEAILVSETGSNATSPYLTKDHKGNPVLCWTAELPN